MRIKCFNRQDKSTSIYYIYVLKQVHRNHAKIQTKRVPKLSSPLYGFLNYQHQITRNSHHTPTPRKFVPLELVPQTVYIHAVKLLSYSFALCFAGGGVLYLRASVNTSIPPLKISCIWTTKPKEFYINKNIFIEDQTT